MRDYDVAIVGGGPAGLSAALTLARSRRRTIVLDSGNARNRASPGVMGYLSRDGIPPADLLRAARAEIVAYGFIEFVDQPVSRIDPLNDRRGFSVETPMQVRISTRYVVLATGVIDLLPDIAGMSDLWGRNVIHCEFCHGWENADRRWCICVDRESDFDWAAGLSNWTGESVMIADAELCTPSHFERLRSNIRIDIERGRVEALIADSTGQLVAVRLEHGRTIPCGTLVLRPAQQQTDIVRSVGVELNGDGRVVVDDFYETTVAGIYAAGDLVPGPQTVTSAAAGGAAIGRRLAYRLATEPGSHRRPHRAMSA